MIENLTILPSTVANDSELVDFRDYDFTNAVMTNCAFTKVDFTGAKFDGAALQRVSFIDCKITSGQLAATWNFGAQQTSQISGLSASTRAALDRAEFENSKSFKEKKLLPEEYGADLWARRYPGGRLLSYYYDEYFFRKENRFILPYAHINEWDFRGFDLSNCAVRAISAMGADFTDAKIEGSYFLGSTLTKERLESTASFKNKSLVGVYLTGDLVLDDVDFSGFDLTDATFDVKSTRGIKLDGATLDGVSFGFHFGANKNPISKQTLETSANYQRKSFRNVKFCDQCDLTDFDFSGCELTNCLFATSLRGANFTDAKIDGCVFSSHSGAVTVEQLKSTWNYKNDKMEGTSVSNQATLDALNESRDEE